MCRKPQGIQTIYWAIAWNIFSICRKLSNAVQRGSPEDFARHKQSLLIIIDVLDNTEVMPMEGRDRIIEALEKIKSLEEYEKIFLGRFDVQKTIDYLNSIKVLC